ncbi:hypothetical protein BH10BAC4_BH10BAC4_14360 [soil metagenome]
MKICISLFLLISALVAHSQGDKQLNPGWEAIKKSKTGTITVFWFDNNPFIYQDEGTGNLKGIEFEVMEGFRNYVHDVYKIDLRIRWEQLKSFEEVFDKIKGEPKGGIFSAGGFSSTASRRKIINLSPSYMADVAVLVSTDDIPLVSTREDFRKYFSRATAITIPGTMMEIDISNLAEAEGVSFKMEFVINSFGFLHAIKNRKKAFGYLSLPVYLMNMSSAIANIKRQNYFTKIKDGHGIGFPKNSDWVVPINAYFKSRMFKASNEAIVSRYIGLDFYNFLKTITSENEVILLNKEKEIQQREILLQEFQIKEKGIRQNFLILIIIIFSLLLIVILALYRNQLRNHRMLKAQNAEIEAQASEIKTINENLELIVKQRTQDLERKNQSLEEYAFITAHKLRAPLASILGLVDLFNRMNLKEEDKVVVKHLEESAQNLDTVIRSVMSAIEAGEADKN